jgi:hypothetical protein
MSAQNYSPAAQTLASTVTIPVDGDAINQDNLFNEASPGGTPKATIAYALDCIKGVITDFGKKAAANTWTQLNTFLAVAIEYAVQASLGTITDAAAAQIGITKWVWLATSVSQQIDVEILDTNAQNGHFLIVGRDPAGAHTVVFHRPGPAAAAIVTLASSQACGAILVRRGGDWRLLFGGQNTTAGADA